MWLRVLCLSFLLLLSSWLSAYSKPSPRFMRRYSHHEQRVTARRDSRARRFYAKKNRHESRLKMRAFRKAHRHTKRKKKGSTIRAVLPTRSTL
ncbi:MULTISPECIES: hypothetical protein [Hymenobacter]|uniref:Uncharacterized protein n=1 Tax=Hymenobacter jejuensis TaxID=2502781 RepID=A0A5B7ZZQ1_9BACT|nr:MULTISPECIES: hypothetical protein [Hymenobacter]MBC6991118.1 hypothetical protein [Hymenobacter sp. BT491]QDA60500.1 hypothetical protein FHG12_10440 [Hymenobacter jejuensis]